MTTAGSKQCKIKKSCLVEIQGRRKGTTIQLNKEHDYETEPLEELFIPFLNDEEEEEFRNLQHLWQNDKDVIEQLKTAINNGEQEVGIQSDKVSVAVWQ